MRMTLLVLLAAVLGCSKGDASSSSKGRDDGPSDTDSTSSQETGQPEDTGLSCESGRPYVEIGTGEDGFEPLFAGDPVTMVHGPQGGWHVLGSVRIWNMGPIVDINFHVTSVLREAVVAENNYRVATVAETDCTGLFWGMYGYLDVHEIAEGDLDTPPELLAYEDLEFRMTVKDTDGREKVSRLIVKGVPDPADLEGGDDPER